MRMEADTVDVRRALPTSSLLVGEGAGSFSKVKLDHTELGSVLGWRWRSIEQIFRGKILRITRHGKQESVKRPRETVLFGVPIPLTLESGRCVR